MNLKLNQAADRAGCSPDHLRKMMKARLAPGTKIGRNWIVPEEVLQQWIDQRCRSTAVPEALTGGSESEERLAARREQVIAARRSNLKKRCRNGSGADTNSATVLPFRSERLLRDG